MTDSTVLSLDVRFAPYRALVFQAATNGLYSVKCGQPPSYNNTVAEVGRGNTEAQALRRGLLARHEVVGLRSDTPLSALAMEGCYGRRGDPVVRHATREQPPSERVSYRAFWTQGGAVSFLRRTSDSSVLTLNVQFASEGIADPGVDFTHYALRCAVPRPEPKISAMEALAQAERMTDPQMRKAALEELDEHYRRLELAHRIGPPDLYEHAIAYLGSGNTEAQALEEPTSQPVGGLKYQRARSGGDSLETRSSALAFVGCAELHRAR